jgi:heat shock protein HtpX
VTLEVLRRRNRLRIFVTLVLATFLYWLAVCAAAIAAALLLVVRVVLEGGPPIPDSGDDFKIIGIVLLAVIAVGAVIGSIVAAVQLPLQRSRLERRVLAETGATVVTGTEHTRVRNLLEALAIAAGIPPPRFAVIDDAAPNSFAVGTRPQKTIVAVTRGAIEKLSRDELEAILAYEVSRVDSWDVALSSWTVALTSAALSKVESGFASVVGWIPRHGSLRLQAWALRDTARERDRAAVRFTRNPLALVHALEALERDRSDISSVTKATAPLWIEVPGTSMLRDRIVAVRALAGMVPGDSDTTDENSPVQPA